MIEKHRRSIIDGHMQAILDCVLQQWSSNARLSTTRNIIRTNSIQANHVVYIETLPSCLRISFDEYSRYQLCSCIFWISNVRYVTSSIILLTLRMKTSIWYSSIENKTFSCFIVINEKLRCRSMFIVRVRVLHKSCTLANVFIVKTLFVCWTIEHCLRNNCEIIYFCTSYCS
jgi:hypothetical protein